MISSKRILFQSDISRYCLYLGCLFSHLGITHFAEYKLGRVIMVQHIVWQMQNNSPSRFLPV